MARGYNKVILIGNMVRDAEMRGRESKVASFTIAVSRSWKDKSGMKQEATDYIKCVAFGSTGEIVGNYTSKGSRIAVDGELREEKYTNQSGEKKSSWVVHVNNVVLLEKRQEAQPTEAELPIEAESFNLDFEQGPELGQVNIPF